MEQAELPQRLCENQSELAKDERWMSLLWVEGDEACRYTPGLFLPEKVGPETGRSAAR